MHQIWDSLAEEPGRTFPTQARRLELERRLAASEAAPLDVVARDEIKSEALARFKRAKKR